jgi:hypothetical protein
VLTVPKNTAQQDSENKDCCVAAVNVASYSKNPGWILVLFLSSSRHVAIPFQNKPRPIPVDQVGIALTLYSCIPELLGSNPNPATNCSDWGFVSLFLGLSRKMSRCYFETSHDHLLVIPSCLSLMAIFPSHSMLYIYIPTRYSIVV